MKLLDAIESAVEKGELPAEGCLLVACSGGADSMAIVDALVRVGRWTLHVASVDHGLHMESAQHVQFVLEHWAGQVEGVYSLTADTAEIRRGNGIEAGARAVRYRLLEAQRLRVGAECVVTAHHADDQAETLLMRLADGAGLAGLRGIHARQARISRPWLGVTRSDIDAYLAHYSVPHVDEPTNSDRRFRRNRLRGLAMPALSDALGSEWVRGAARSAAILQEELRGEQRSDALSALVFGPHAVGVYVAVVEGQTGLRTAIFSALKWAFERWRPASARGIGRHVDTVAELVDSGLSTGARDLGQGLKVWREQDVVWIGLKTRSKPMLVPIAIHGPGIVRWGPWLVEITEKGGRDDSYMGTSPLISLAKAPFPWLMRAWSQGDRFHRAGAPGGKKLSRQWGDRKIPVELRAGLPLIEAGDRLLWVGQLGCADAVVTDVEGEGVEIALNWAPSDAMDGRY